MPFDPEAIAAQRAQAALDDLDRKQSHYNPPRPAEHSLARIADALERLVPLAEKLYQQQARICGNCARQHTSCPYFPPVPFPPDPTKPRGPRDDGPACDKFTRK